MHLPFRAALLFSGFSITLSLLTFTVSFKLFRGHWNRLFLHPQRFLAGSQGRFVHILDSNEDPAPKEANSPFLYLTKHEFFELQGLAKETIQLNSHTNYITNPFHPTSLHEFILTSQPLIIPRR